MCVFMIGIFKGFFNFELNMICIFLLSFVNVFIIYVEVISVLGKCRVYFCYKVF